MNVTFGELKLRSRRSLYGNFGSLAGVQILLMAASAFLVPVIYVLLVPMIVAAVMIDTARGMLFSLAFFGAILILYLAVVLLFTLFKIGISKIYLELAQARPFVFGDVFFAFRNGIWKFIGISALIFGMSLAASLLPLVSMLLFRNTSYAEPVQTVFQCIQIILTLWIVTSFAFPFNLLIENPEKGVFQCMRESYGLMRGNRIRYLLLAISFFGWYLLIYTTVGIGCVWVGPYLLCTFTHFYLDLREKNRMAGVAAPGYDGYGYTEPGYEETVYEEPVYEEPINQEPERKENSDKERKQDQSEQEG